jgi:cob(I)alamin adenosyltransferase
MRVCGACSPSCSSRPAAGTRGGRIYTRRPMSRSRDEPVRLTKIYTRGGDTGETSRGDGKRVPKTDLRIAAYGTVDELNSLLGLALASDDLPDEFRPWLEQVQNDLFDVGADLAVPLSDERERLRARQSQVDRLEELCDLVNERLEPLKSFVLPGGGEAAARLHVARTVCRRAEREAVALAEAEDASPVALAYLNRLSDLLFILARAAVGGEEPLWKPGASR